MRDAITRIAMRGAALVLALVLSLALAPSLRAADEDSGPELDKQRVATCEARGGRLARNHLGQMLCKDAKVKLKAYLKQTPDAATVAAAPAAAPVAPAPGVTAKGPEYTSVPGATHEVTAGPPTMPPPQPTDIPGGGTGSGGGGSGGGVGGTGGKTPPPGLPPVLQPNKTPGGACYLRACLYSSYTKSCQCQVYNSTELCQFQQTTVGGTCGSPQGMTTALCPAGYSCINNSCRKEPSC